MFVPSCCQVQEMSMEKVFSGTLVSQESLMGSPSSLNVPLSTPSSLLNMYVQIVPVATKEIVSGMKKIDLKKFSPLQPGDEHGDQEAAQGPGTRA